MKKLSAISIGLVLTTTVFSSCNKEDCGKTVFDATFYSSKAPGNYTLYIDNVEKGTLNYLAIAPQCGQTFDEGTQPLKLQLPSGTYSISARNQQGQTVSAATLTINKRSGRLTGGIGGASVSSTESCVIIGLSE